MRNASLFYMPSYSVILLIFQIVKEVIFKLKLIQLHANKTIEEDSVYNIARFCIHNRMSLTFFLLAKKKHEFSLHTTLVRKITFRMIIRHNINLESVILEFSRNQCFTSTFRLSKKLVRIGVERKENLCAFNRIYSDFSIWINYRIFFATK